MSTDAFRYEIDRVRSPFSKAELIASLKKYAQSHNVESFGMRDYNAWCGKVAHAETIRVRFGTWGKALQAAACRSVRGHKLDPKAMVSAFRDCWRDCGSVPTLRQLEEFLQRHNHSFRTKTYGTFFGGVGSLARRIVAFQAGSLSETDLYRKQRVERQRNSPVSLKLRTAVLKRDGCRCVKCGASPSQDKSVRLEVDHIKADARGGKATMENLQTLCWACNQGGKDGDN